MAKIISENVPTEIAEAKAEAEEVETETVEPITVYRAGPVFRQLQTDFTKAFLSQDRAAYDDCAKRLDALKALYVETKHQVIAAYDQSTSGFTNADWLNGVERLVKKVEPGTRGR